MISDHKLQLKYFFDACWFRRKLFLLLAFFELRLSSFCNWICRSSTCISLWSGLKSIYPFIELVLRINVTQGLLTLSPKAQILSFPQPRRPLNFLESSFSSAYFPSDLDLSCLPWAVPPWIPLQHRSSHYCYWRCPENTPSGGSLRALLFLETFIFQRKSAWALGCTRSDRLGSIAWRVRRICSLFSDAFDVIFMQVALLLDFS